MFSRDTGLIAKEGVVLMAKNGHRSEPTSSTPNDTQLTSFVEVARALEGDESEERFDTALRKIALFKKEEAVSPLDEFWERARIRGERGGL
jgi:hypothetical protein